MPSIALNNDKYYQARIGYNEKKIEVDDFKTKIIFPYIGDELGPTPPFKATSGRFNRHGCAFLYLASDTDTEISEIKPDIGHIISLGEFVTNDNRPFLDLRGTAVEKILIEDDVILKNILESLQRLFSTLIPKEEGFKYLVTQFNADIFRELDFAGIIYDSSLSSGFNITAFYPSKFSIMNLSERLYKTKKVTYSYSEIKDERKKYSNFNFESEDDDKYYL